jgi:aminoacrylate hydrolase
MRARTLVAGQHRWHYYVGTGHGETVLLLPGGTGIGIGWLDLALALHPRYRAISVDYPHSVSTFDDLAEGVLAVLEAENVEQVHVVGQSAGGMLAEVFSRLAPDRVRSMVLSGTGLYGPEDVPRLEQRLAAIQTTPWQQTRAAILDGLRHTWKDAAEAEF